MMKNVFCIVTLKNMLVVKINIHKIYMVWAYTTHFKRQKIKASYNHMHVLLQIKPVTFPDEDKNITLLLNL